MTSETYCFVFNLLNMQTRFPNVKSDGNMNYKKHSAQIIDESDEIDEL